MKCLSFKMDKPFGILQLTNLSCKTCCCVSLETSVLTDEEEHCRLGLCEGLEQRPVDEQLLRLVHGKLDGLFGREGR